MRIESQEVSHEAWPGRGRWLLAALVACVSVLPCVVADAASAVSVVPRSQQAALLQSGDPVAARNKKIVYDAWRARKGAGDLVTLIAEGDAVALATLDVSQHPEDPDVHFEAVHFEYFQLADGKIVEQHEAPRFSLSQILEALKHPVPSAPPEPGVATENAVPVEQQADRLIGNPDPRLAANKRVVFDFFRVTLVSGRLEETPQYATRSYIQHNPTVPSGRDELVKVLSGFIKPAPTISPGLPGLIRVLAERDMVVLVQQRVAEGKPTWMFDMFRVESGGAEDGKVAEHWDSARDPSEIGAVRKSEPDKLFPASNLVRASKVGKTGGPGPDVPKSVPERLALGGVWRIAQPVLAVTTLSGQAPPLTAAGQKLYEQRVAARLAGDITFDATTWCAGAGIPRLMLMDSPFQIALQPNDTVFFYFQWNRWARLVYVTKSKLSVTGTSSMGVPTGRWERNTLVIDSEGFRQNTLLDNAGLPHSELLRVTERLRIVERDMLENRITISDPGYYTQPWEMRVTYRRQTQTQIVEHVCLDFPPGQSLVSEPDAR